MSHITIYHDETFCDPITQGGSETGQVKSGRLSIEGDVLPVKPITKRTGEREHLVDYLQLRNGSRLRVNFDEILPLNVKVGDVGCKCWPEGGHITCDVCDPDLTGEDWSLEKAKYWCLKVATYCPYVPCTFYLILQRADEGETVESKDEVWIRVGIGLATKIRRGELQLDSAGSERRKIVII